MAKSDDDEVGNAGRITERYGNVLGLGPVVRAAPPVPVSTDPLAAFRLAGVVETGGEQIAIFVIEAGDTQRVVSLKRGEEAVDQWVVDQIGTSSALLRKAGASRKFTLFE